MNYVVAGVGYVGRRVLASLPAGRALGLNRSPVTAAGREVRRLDFDADGPPVELPRPGTLLYTAPPPGSGETDARLERLLARLAAPPVRIVYLSTSGVYGDREGALTDEATPAAPGNARSRRRLAAETALSRWCSRHGTDAFVLRVPGIYGPYRIGTDRLAAGTTILRDADAGPGNRIHVDDLVTCCLAAMTTTTAPPGIYNVGDGDHRSASWFSRTVARLAGLPAPREISMDDAVREWSDMRLSFVRESRRLDTRRMRELLGVTPTYADAETGIRASLATQDT